MSSTGPYAGSKRKARIEARERARSDDFKSDMERLAALVSHIEDESDLDVILAHAGCSDQMKDEVRKLVVALRSKQLAEEKRVELVAPGDVDRVLADLNPTSAPALVRES